MLHLITCHGRIMPCLGCSCCIDIVEIWFGIANGQISSVFMPCNKKWYRHSGSVIGRPLCDQEVAGSIPGLKMVLAALLLSIKKVELELVSSVSV